MLQSRFPPARSSDDDARSDASWTTVRTSEIGEAETLGAGVDQHQGRGMDPIAEEVKNVPPPPATQNAWGNPTPPSAAPVNQAARNLLDHTNEPPAARRLRRQQEKAEQMGAHNACNAQLPGHIRQVGSQAGERSVLILDSRDHRMQSPFQGRLLDEILTNANTMLNVVSDASQGLPLQPVHDQGLGQFQVGDRRNYDLVWFCAVWQMGSPYSGRHVPHGFSAF